MSHTFKLPFLQHFHWRPLHCTENPADQSLFEIDTAANDESNSRTFFLLWRKHPRAGLCSTLSTITASLFLALLDLRGAKHQFYEEAKNNSRRPYQTNSVKGNGICFNVLSCWSRMHSRVGWMFCGRVMAGNPRLMFFKNARLSLIIFQKQEVLTSAYSFPWNGSHSAHNRLTSSLHDHTLELAFFPLFSPRFMHLYVVRGISSPPLAGWIVSSPSPGLTRFPPAVCLLRNMTV